MKTFSNGMTRFARARLDTAISPDELQDNGAQRTAHFRRQLNSTVAQGPNDKWSDQDKFVFYLA